MDITKVGMCHVHVFTRSTEVEIQESASWGFGKRVGGACRDGYWNAGTLLRCLLDL